MIVLGEFGDLQKGRCFWCGEEEIETIEVKMKDGAATSTGASTAVEAPTPFMRAFWR